MIPPIRFEPARSVLFAAAVAVLAGPPALQAQTYLEQLGYEKLKDRLGTGMPDGTGVPVGHCEASISTASLVYLPQAGPGTFAGSGNFSGKTFTDQSAGPGTASGHSQSVASYFYGNNTDPGAGLAGMAPGVTAIKCLEANDYFTDPVGPAQPAYTEARVERVHSAAWIGGNSSFNGDLQKYDRDIDDYGYLPVVGLNNGSGTTVPVLLASAYNVLSAGRTDGLHSRGGTPAGIDGVGRMKPELVAPFNATSWATGSLSSIASVLYGVAQDSGFTTAYSRNEVVKAVMMAGATKEEFFRVSPPYTWSRTETKPLDAIYGAGEANLCESYEILSGGQQAAGTTVGANGWDYASIVNTTTNRDYAITVPEGCYANELSVVVTWNRYRSGLSYIVNDLVLELRSLTGSPVTVWDASDSAVDNVEHVYYRNLAPGDYVIRVKRKDTQSGTADYAIAWRMELGAGPQIEASVAGTGVTLDMSQLDPRVTYRLYRSTDLVAWTLLPPAFSPLVTTHAKSDTVIAGTPVCYRIEWDPYFLRTDP